MMIQLPPKIWRPKPANKYVPVDYSDDIDEGVFDYSHHGNAVYRPKEKWADKNRDDIITFDNENNMEELMQNLHIGKNVKEIYKCQIIGIVKKYWDFFCAKGARRTILDYEFATDTGASKPACCRQPKYSPHGKPITMD